MRFGGHQTFTIRDGWLHKGLQLLIDTKKRGLLVDEFAFDHLGVGKNMAKSINHWLIATGLGEKEKEQGKSGKMIETKNILPTDLAELIWKNDPYFLDSGTWWVIHINLVNTPLHVATWNWFFNKFTVDRFQKQLCLQSLTRFESLNTARSISPTTMERDLSCFLSTYSKEIPSRKKDPEEDIDCPLRDLGLLTYYRNSDFYHVNKSKKLINPLIMLYALSKIKTASNDNKWNEIMFFELLRKENNPGRIFAQSNEDLFESLLELEKQTPYFKLVGLAGERVVRFKNKKDIEWIIEYYSKGGES